MYRLVNCIGSKNSDHPAVKKNMSAQVHVTLCVSRICNELIYWYSMLISDELDI